MPREIEVRVPDIGDFEDVEVIEVLVAKGDTVEVEDSLVTLESDKATMEIPSPAAGVVAEVRIRLGERVSEGAILVLLEAEEAVPAGDAIEAVDREREADAAPEPAAEEAAPAPRPGEPPPSVPPVAPAPVEDVDRPHASPLIRRMAREWGVDLSQTGASGPHGRVLAEDLQAHVRAVISGEGGASGGIPPVRRVDFARFGEIEEVPLSRVRQHAARNLSRSWLNLPHVTQHDEADITELEAFRRHSAETAAARGVKLSPLVFVMKASVLALRRYPDFGSSLSPDGAHLIRKKTYHIGVAVDTDEGLVVPVVRDVDRKGLLDLAEETARLAEKARAGKLAPADMQGACFTISSLGGIGGTAFTPIVNAPEVALLGVSRTVVKPVWTRGLDVSAEGGGSFEPRLILPLSLSYDHRVIDGAAAVRFTTFLGSTLSDPVQLLL